MASKMAAVRMEIIEMTIFSLFLHPEINVLLVSIYMFCHPRNMMEWVSIGFGNAKHKMAANMQIKAAITEIPFLVIAHYKYEIKGCNRCLHLGFQGLLF